MKTLVEVENCVVVPPEVGASLDKCDFRVQFACRRHAREVFSEAFLAEVARGHEGYGGYNTDNMYLEFAICTFGEADTDACDVG